eukprot:TRINITY_DN13125_c0_g1_i3.p1 TRINITY_DN13125_c0_g1~~TRINITY_DN13125_c0_g1_i3.p1  ORF type:complete len:652 (+),score=181.59 TRINITY_DN13125_c0_g1_i3:105-1958(+)
MLRSLVGSEMCIRDRKSVVLHGSAVRDQVKAPETMQKKATDVAREAMAAKQAMVPKEPPPPDQFVVEHPKHVSSLEVDIVKLTAQFVAKNGRQFLTGLQNRESRNTQFDFLKPSHHLFTYFTVMVDQYTKSMHPAPSVLEKMKKLTVEEGAGLAAATRKLEWKQYTDGVNKKKEDKEELERDLMNSIDWHDFVVVETIEFDINEEVAAAPPPVPPPEPEPVQPAAPAPVPEQPAPPAQGGQAMKIRKDWQPNMMKQADTTFKDPLTGQVVGGDINEHMRITMLDPRWREQKRVEEEKRKETNYTSNEQISMSLNRFSAQRTDIFGHGNEVPDQDATEKMTLEEQINRIRGVKEQEMEFFPRHQHKAPMPAAMSHAAPPMPAAAAPPMPRPAPPSMPPQQPPSMPPGPTPPGLAARPPAASAPPSAPPGPPGLPPGLPPAARPPPAQQAAFTAPPSAPPRPPGGAPPMGMPRMPPMPSMAPPMRPPVPAGAPPAQARAPPPMPAPDPKRQKTLATNLMSEGEFSAYHPGEVSIQIQVPVQEHDTWTLKGQVTAVSVSVMATVKQLKDKLGEQLGGMPAKSQKLKSGVAFLKDNLTLAHYNIGPGSMLELGVQQRGGRK